ncbi:MAG: nucleotidyltransferase family protein [Candidatus Thermoplasmatota archaeon]|jgi:molybdenum cofactor cytidylyltransferase|nr:nucleotidyltransferase family protein [Candidatus Thermoplasmatota archaeon]MDP7265515.1 nucleotidyltransferase family protein [Candidatus Thermoplasmatota archaeon]
MHVSAIVLAAGRSRRFGEGPTKILSKVKNKTILRQLMETISRCAVTDVILVTGHQGEQVSEHARNKINSIFAHCNKKFIMVHNARYEEGMAVSFREGIKAVPQDSEAYLLFLGDQPLVSENTVHQIIETYRDINTSGKNYLLIHPRFNGKKGHPVLFSSDLRPEIEMLGKDDQVRYLTWRYREKAFILDVDDPGINIDVNTAEDLDDLRRI